MSGTVRVLLRRPTRHADDGGDDDDDDVVKEEEEDAARCVTSTGR